MDDLNNDKWTCPNDRHLLLRSKLNAGWSCHTTSSTTPTKLAQISESEMLTIQNVLKRNEMLEKLEQERVKKLYERIENMKRNSLKNDLSTATRQCSLCGDYMYILSGTMHKCCMCFKYICSKCSIIASSSAFLMSPTNLTHTTHLKSPVTLCRICSEQRELWKKSGAWFLKKLPIEHVTHSHKSPQNAKKSLADLVNAPKDKQIVTQIKWKSSKKNESSSDSSFDNDADEARSKVSIQITSSKLKSNSSTDSSAHTSNLPSLEDTNSSPTTPTSLKSANHFNFETKSTNNIPVKKTRAKVLDWCQTSITSDTNASDKSPYNKSQTTAFIKRHFLKPQNEFSD